MENDLKNVEDETALDPESRQVFELLRRASEQYESFLKTQESLGPLPFEEPSMEDYSWDKPLTIVFAR